jgi:hypothetical protein
MEIRKEMTKHTKDRKNERGAALITVLMISFLLLVAVIALLLESSMNTANVTDATSEEQAYYAAESGIQSTIDALRHNPAPSPLIDPSKLPYPPDPDADDANQIDYLKAVRRETSNQCTKSGMTFTCADPLDRSPNDLRLSRWLPYNWGPSGGAGATSKDRIVLGDPATYSPINGFAYSVKVSDPDNTGGTVSYAVSGGIMDASGNLVSSRQFGSGGDTTTIEFVPSGAQTVDVSSGSGNGNIGSFRLTNTGSGAAPPSGDGLVRFKITMTVSQPQNTYVVIRGYIIPSGSDLTGSPNCPRPTTGYLFDSPGFIAFGSRTTLTNTGCLVEEVPNTHNGPYGTYLTGYLVQPAASGVDLPITAMITQPEPTRLLVKSTGYGPRGSKKELETIIQKNYFNGLGAPSPLLLMGPPCTAIAIPTSPCVQGNPATDFIFDPGNSNPIFYSGKDTKLKVFLPPIGLTNDPNLQNVKTTISTFNGKVFGNVENVANELPFWLQNPKNLDDTIQLLKASAQSSGTYWGPASSPPTSGVYGDWTNATGITFVDRDVTISQDGGGILVVTGQLNFKGDFRFNGLVLITGPPSVTSEGGFMRNGGGTGLLAGNMIVAPYNSWSLNTCMPNVAVTNKLDCYLSPYYKISGGGTSDLMYNSQNVTNGLSGLGNFVKGVAEK